MRISKIHVLKCDVCSLKAYGSYSYAEERYLIAVIIFSHYSALRDPKVVNSAGSFKAMAANKVYYAKEQKGREPFKQVAELKSLLASVPFCPITLSGEMFLSFSFSSFSPFLSLISFPHIKKN